MSKLKREAELIEREYLKMAQSGLDEQFFKLVPVLFHRIRELEQALEPFGNTYIREAPLNTRVAYANMSDCKRAYDVLIDNAPREQTELQVL